MGLPPELLSTFPYLSPLAFPQKIDFGSGIMESECKVLNMAWQAKEGGGGVAVDVEEQRS